MRLAIDTSGAISVAIVDGQDVVSSHTEYAPRHHAEHLSPMVRDALAQAAAPTITQVVVGTGPGPFTGLRVGIMTARTLGAAWGVPVVGICSLDAMGAAHGGDVTVVADARRKEVYWARYGAGTRVDGPHVAQPSIVPRDTAVVGRGAELYRDIFGSDLNPQFRDVDAAWLARLADQVGAVPDEHPTTPMYLRRPDVHQ